MRLPSLILSLIFLAVLLPAFRRWWKSFRHTRLVADMRAGLRRDALVTTLICVDPETDQELDLHVEGDEFGIFCVKSTEPGFAILLMIATNQDFYSLTEISPFHAGERSPLRDGTGSPLVALGPIVPEGEIRFGYSGRLFYLLAARSREPLEMFKAAEGLGGVPMEAMEGIALSRLPNARRAAM